MKYKINKNQYVNRWLLSTLEEKEYLVPTEPLKCKFDTNFFKNFTKGIIPYEYNCRSYFLENMQKREIELETLTYSEIHFPFENNQVEFSGFWFVPTYVKRWAKAVFEGDGVYRFRLKTCGGVKIWADGKEVITFVPYIRNYTTETEFEIDITGRKEIVVMFDDLCERDEIYFFSLELISNNFLDIDLETSVSDEKIEELESFMDGLYFEKDFYVEGNLILKFSKELRYDISLEVGAKEAFLHGESFNKKIELKKGTSEADLGKVELYDMSYQHFQFTYREEKIKITKHLGVEISHLSKQRNDFLTLEERRKHALKFIGENGERTTQRVLAALMSGNYSTEIKEILEEELDKIERRFDCADFSLTAIMWMLKKCKDNPIFTKEMKERIKKVVLNFRYWMDEPGNDVMWYFSENHALLFHTCQMIAGEIYPDEIFTNSSKTGREQEEAGRKHLDRWFENFQKDELVEWNSIPYIPIDLLGLFTIFDLTGNIDLKEKAKLGIERLLNIMAINFFNGNMAGSQGRSYDKTLKGRYSNEITQMAWITSNNGWLNSSARFTPFYCLSSYELTDKFKEIMNFKGVLNYKYSQGIENYVDLEIYKNNLYSLATAQNHKSFKYGYQENVVQGVMGDKAEISIYINHPGEMISHGFKRPGYWGGNGILPHVEQFKNISLIKYQIREDEIGFTHAYFPSYLFDEYEINGKWVFARKNDAYVALYADNGLSMVTEGESSYRELISEGRENFWLMKFSSREEIESFEMFKISLKNTEFKKSEEHIEFQDLQFGNIKFISEKHMKINNEILKRNYTIKGEIQLD